ncbi:AMP-binding protein [Streptomyces sp. NPDC001552]|uniref:AMP-binding protein n=1 Tax=Streptomyces sp. NPDC001552 TaxID=3364587 RepID=UPI003678E7A7
MVNLIRDVATRFEVDARDRLLAISGLHFDASIYDVFGVLTQGGTVVLPPPFEHAEPDVRADLVRAEQVTLWNSVPRLMELLVGEARCASGAAAAGRWSPCGCPCSPATGSRRASVALSW